MRAQRRRRFVTCSLSRISRLPFAEPFGEATMKKRLIFTALTSVCALSAAVELALLGSRHACVSAIEPIPRSSFAAVSRPDIVRSEARNVQLPLSFERNQGQTDSQVKFLSRGNGYTLYLTPTETLLSLRRPSAQRGVKGRMAVLQQRKFDRPEHTLLRMKFTGGNPAPSVFGVDELNGKCNYFIGNDASRWRTNVPTFAKVKYENIYPGIDLVYYGNQRRLEYDFVVAPGAEPKAIELSFPDAKNLALDANGELLVRVGEEEIIEHAPLVYQEANGQRRNATGRYVLKGKNRVAFEVGAIDPSRAVVIDPAIEYSTYLGGSGDENPLYMALDRFGDVYLTGFTNSIDFPTTAGSFQTNNAGGPFDAYVTKLSPDGSALLYSTYLGGSGDDEALGIAIDDSGHAYVVGSTSSPDFPTTQGAFQPSFAGGNTDGFVTKLSADGSALTYSTYFGGSGDDFVFIGPTDRGGHVYAEGFTSSTDFPTTPGAFQRTFAGGPDDSFVAKLNHDGTGLIFSTYLGGTGDDLGIDGTIDRFGNAYFTGLTSSTDFPTTPRAFQPTFGGGNIDTFVTKLSRDGSHLLYSTYLGGSGDENPFDLAVDRYGNAYVPGQTSSLDFPTTPEAFQTSFTGGNVDGYLTKIDPTGSGVVYSTYLGGSGDDLAGAVRVDKRGNAYVPGATSSTDFPTTADAFQSSNAGGNSDAFVLKLNPTGSGLVFSSYLGGSGDDSSVGAGTGVDRFGNMYVYGSTSSTDFPITEHAVQPQYGGGISDAFVTKIAIGEGDDRQAAVHRGAPGSPHNSDLAIPRVRVQNRLRNRLR
jgi:Beta-propeller repeat